jgi:hypothetical protein
MQRPPASAVRTRVPAILPVLLVHALLFLVLIRGKEADRAIPPSAPSVQLVNVWIHLPRGSAPGAAQTTALAISTVGILPDWTSASLDAPAPNVELPVPTEFHARPEQTQVDWYGEASRLAALAAATDEVPSLVSGSVRQMREPCESRRSSFEWNPAQERRGLLPLPYMMLGERCVVGLGFFGCALGALPEPNSRLFDDMREGSTPGSSVPSPHSCD